MSNRERQLKPARQRTPRAAQPPATDRPAHRDAFVPMKGLRSIIFLLAHCSNELNSSITRLAIAPPSCVRLSPCVLLQYSHAYITLLFAHTHTHTQSIPTHYPAPSGTRKIVTDVGWIGSSTLKPTPCGTGTTASATNDRITFFCTVRRT